MSFFRANTISKQSEPTKRECKHSITATVRCERVSPESARAAIQQLREDLNSCRIRNERAIDSSREFAKHYKCR